LPIQAFSEDLAFDLKVGYVKTGSVDVEKTGNGIVLGSGAYYSVYKTDSFIENIYVGLGMDFLITKDSVGVLYNLALMPELRVAMPYSYFKFGLGYSYIKDSGISDNGVISKWGLALIIPISERISAGIEGSFAYKFTKGRIGKYWILGLGAVLSFVF
jgi:hypothetical protein